MQLRCTPHLVVTVITNNNRKPLAVCWSANGTQHTLDTLQTNLVGLKLVIHKLVSLLSTARRSGEIVKVFVAFPLQSTQVSATNTAWNLQVESLRDRIEKIARVLEKPRRLGSVTNARVSSLEQDIP